MKNHSRYYSLSLAINPLTRVSFTSSIKSLIKSSSGLSQPSYLRFFCACLMAQLCLFYGGSRVLNTIPLGNKHRRLLAVSEACHPKLNGVAISKLNLVGDTMSKSNPRINAQHLIQQAKLSHLTLFVATSREV